MSFARTISYKSIVPSARDPSRFKVDETPHGYQYAEEATASETCYEDEEVGPVSTSYDNAIAGTYLLYFQDSCLERSFGDFLWGKVEGRLYVTWCSGTFVVGLNWIPWLLGVNRTRELSWTFPSVALAIVIFLHILVIQVIPFIPRMSHSWIAPEVKLVVMFILGGMSIPLGSLYRVGVFTANDSSYFTDAGHSSSDVFCLLGVILSAQYCFNVLPLRCSRSWPIPIIILTTYSILSLPGWSPHPFSEILIIIPSLSTVILCSCYGRYRAELQERKKWYRIQRLSADVVQMKLSLQSDLEFQKATQSQHLLNEFAQALEQQNENEISAVRQRLIDHGFSEDDIAERTRTILKKLSEEAGVSVAYLISPEFEALARRSTGKEDPTFYDLRDAFFFKEGIGRHTECPRDGKRGCALIDTLPHQHRRRVTHFLSWLWQYKLSTVRSSLAEWLHAQSLDPNEVFLYMCFFVNNQYRILVDGVAFGSDNLGSLFESNLRRSQEVLAILEGWDSPAYLDRIWTIFEQFTAINLGMPVTIIMPQAAASTLISEFERGKRGILKVKDALSRVDSKAAKASIDDDEIRVKECISSGVGFDIVNSKISDFMIAWVSLQLQSYMNRLVHGGLSADDNESVISVTSI